MIIYINKYAGPIGIFAL